MTAVDDAARESPRWRAQRDRLAVDASEDIVWGWERATGTVVWNQRLTDAFGWSVDAPGHTLDESIAWVVAHAHPADRDEVRSALHDAMEGRRTRWRVEHRLQRADGGYAVVLERGVVEQGDDGSPSRIVATLRDVTRHVSLEGEQRFLAEASRVLASSLDEDETLRAVARLALPALADWSAVALLDARGEARAVAGAHSDPAKEPILQELQRRYPPTTTDARPVATVLRTGRSIVLPVIGDDDLRATSLDDAHLALRRAIGFASLLIVPLTVGGRTLGALTFTCGPDRPPYHPDDLPIAEEVGRRAAVAIEHARLYREAQEQAEAHAALSRALREAAEARRQSELRFRLLADALLAVGASGTRDTDAVLDEVALQARSVFGAQHAGVQLRVPGGEEFVRRRSSPLATTGDLFEPGRRFRPDALARTAIDQGRALFVADFQNDERVDLAVRQALPDVASSMVVPMVVEGETSGFLFVHWVTRYEEGPGDAAAALLLAQHAAAIVRTARALEEARAAEAVAQETVRQRDVFLGVAAHELKTPVTSLRAYAQAVLRRIERYGELEPGLIGRALTTIDQGSRRLAMLVEQLLVVTRLESGRLQISPERLDLIASIAAAAEGLRVLYPQHELRLSAVGEPIVRADSLRVEQVLANLVGNAARYAPPGTPIQIEVRPAPGGALLAVRDHGPGVPDVDRERIFDRFQQGSGAGHAGGMGLGLYVSRQIAELHGGTLELESPSDGGARFVLFLPAD
jgi:signal transduction histidine kinase